MMSTLTDRYISEVVRRLPESQREDISSEIAATIEDMVAAELRTPGDHTATAGHDDPDAAERAVLGRLGDPAELARRYSGARRYLVGPDVYPVWLRVLRWLMPVVGVIAAVSAGITYVSTTPDAAIGGLIGEAVSSVVTALMWVFTIWTLVVVLLERLTLEGDRNPLAIDSTWDPADLRRTPAWTEPRVDAIVSLVLLAFLAALPFVPSTFLYIGHLNGGEALIDPGIPTIWLAGYLVLIGLLACLQLWRLARPGPTSRRLAAEVGIDVAFGVFLTALILSRDSILHPDILAAVPEDLPTTVIRWSLVVGIWLIVAWDQVETVRSYRRDTAAVH